MNPNRPVVRVNDEGARWFDDPPLLLDRITLSLSVFDTQVRSEVWQQKGAPSSAGRLRWQHHAPLPSNSDEASALAVRYLVETAAWLERNGWPGLEW